MTHFPSGPLRAAPCGASDSHGSGRRAFALWGGDAAPRCGCEELAGPSLFGQLLRQRPTRVWAPVVPGGRGAHLPETRGRDDPRAVTVTPPRGRGKVVLSPAHARLRRRPPASPLTCSVGSGGRRGPAPDSRSGPAAARSARASPSSSRAPPLSPPPRSSPAEHIPPDGPGHAAPGRAACRPLIAAGRGLPRAPRGSWAPGVPAPPGPSCHPPAPPPASGRGSAGARLRRGHSGAGRREGGGGGGGGTTVGRG